MKPGKIIFVVIFAASSIYADMGTSQEHPESACLSMAEKLLLKENNKVNSCLEVAEDLIVKSNKKDEFETMLEEAHWQARKYTAIPNGLIKQIKETVINKYPKSSLDQQIQEGIVQMESFFRLQRMRKDFPVLKPLLDKEAQLVPNDFSEQLSCITICIQKSGEKTENLYRALKYGKYLYDF